MVFVEDDSDGNFVSRKLSNVLIWDTIAFELIQFVGLYGLKF